MEAKYERIFKECKVAAELMNKLSFLAPNEDIDIQLCHQIFEKNPNPPSEFSEEFQKILRLLKKHSALMWLTTIQGKTLHATKVRIDDQNFHNFLRENQNKDEDCLNLLDLAEILRMILVESKDMDFDLIPHIGSVRKNLKEESSGNGGSNTIGMRIKCWWSQKRIGKKETLKRLDKLIAIKLNKIYLKHIEKLTVLARREQILKNFEICQRPSDPLYEISLQDYTNWIFQTLIKFKKTCPKIFKIGIKTLGGLGRINILPDNLHSEILDYAATYEEDGWDSFLFYLSKSLMSIKNQDNEAEKICQIFVKKLRLEFHKKDPIKADRWIRIWGNLKSIYDDKRMGKIMQSELMTEPQGIKLIIRSMKLDLNVADFNLNTWAKSQGFIFENIRTFLQDKSEADLARLEILQCRKFMIQMTSFLPRFFEKFKDNVLTLTAWKLIEPYCGTIVKSSESSNSLEKLLDLQILNSLKSTLEIINHLKAPTDFGEDLVKNKFRVLIFVLIFCLMGRLNERDRINKFLQNFFCELDNFDYVSHCRNRKTWPWPHYWAHPLRNFVNIYQQSTPTGTVDQAVKIAQKIVEGLEPPPTKWKELHIQYVK